MTDRSFTEIHLRAMLQAARSYRKDVVPGRWIVTTRHRGKAWEVTVEPDESLTMLVVVTAYPA
jgi:hypothetical protein